MKAANVPLKKGKMKGASNTGKEWVGDEVTLKHIYEIAKIKRSVRQKWTVIRRTSTTNTGVQEQRLSGLSEESLVKSIVGSAKSMGIKIVP